MTDPNSKTDFHVLVIGAGSVGLLIAQRLKTVLLGIFPTIITYIPSSSALSPADTLKLDIRCTVFERESYLNQRSRDWSFGIYWAQGHLGECLPEPLRAKLSTATVDPSRTPSPKDFIRVLNGKTAEELARVPTPNFLRLRRSTFRAPLVEGVDVQYGKKLIAISHIPTDEGGPMVTATFEDGTSATGNLLVGADGAKSIVRQHLLGPEQAALQQLPIIGCHAIQTFPADIARKVIAELHGQVFILTFNPARVCVFFVVHDIPDHSRPETWQWRPTITFRREGSHQLTDPAEIRKAWNEKSEQTAEPFRSALLSLPDDAVIWSERLAQWPTVAWDNKQGTVTLAGDAAHPMTYHRGQGLNNAVHDAANLGRALNDYRANGTPHTDALACYEAEVVKRGREAVLSSGQNSVMVHDWGQLMDSPLFRHGSAAAAAGT